ncbi:MAG: hypothetical protein K4571_17985 [Deltaproteobacteria bacterium]
MIENNTVFVLGAGASCSYGFPSGENLKKEAVSAVKDDFSSFLLLGTYRVVPNEEVQRSKCMAFAEALSHAGQASIDAFLYANRHQKGFDAIGKAAIAQVLLRYEDEVSDESDDDWLGYLFKIMIDGISSPDQFIAQNNVSFITFNYDRFLEKWLYKRIKHSFGLDDSSALSVLSKIPIHHVYGILGSFPSPDQDHPSPWVVASTGIKTIFDVEKNVMAPEESKSLLLNANVICLLGFGFHRENIDLLDLVSCSNKCKKRNGVVAASRYDLSEVEIKRLLRPFEDFIDFKLSPKDHRCLMAIRNLPIF